MCFDSLDKVLIEIRRRNQTMNALKKSLSTLLVVCSLGVIFGSLGCNTVHGVGQDIERGGEKTQDAADAVKRRM